jgi:hypothetical protein
MNTNPDYTFANHPLKRIHEAGLTPYFRRERCSIVCPVCRGRLTLFIFTRTGQQAFLLCSACAWFRERSTLYEILHQVERQPKPSASGRRMSAALDAALAHIITPKQRRLARYRHLSGARRHAKK